MRALQLRDLLEVLDGGVVKVTAPDALAAQATRYVARVWNECRLLGMQSAAIDYCALAKSNGRYLCYFGVGRRDCFLVVVSAADGLPEGHILFDVGAQYRPVEHADLSTGFVGAPTESGLARSLSHLSEGGTPAAVLTSGEGSYLQTYQSGPNAFTLEYQLVTTAFHFAVAGPVPLESVLRAFHSYAFGKYEWAREHAWVRQATP